ncbi:hypothetical protein D3C80_1435010 [compost metagenome]
MPGVLHTQYIRIGTHGPFAGGIGGDVGRVHQGKQRRHVDHLALRAQQRRQEPRGQLPGGQQVDFQGAAHVVVNPRLAALQGQHPGIVDQDVDVAEALQDRGGGFVQALAVAQVEQVVGIEVEGRVRFEPVDADHGCTLLLELARGFQAQAACRAGDDDDLVEQFHRVTPLAMLKVAPCR